MPRALAAVLLLVEGELHRLFRMQPLQAFEQLATGLLEKRQAAGAGTDLDLQLAMAMQDLHLHGAELG